MTGTTLLAAPAAPTLPAVFTSEVLGTAILLLLGCGVVANAALPKTKGGNANFLMVGFGWGLGVFAGVYVAYRSGAHLNPAVTVGILTSGGDEYAPGVPVTLATTLVYFAAQLLGAFLGAVAAWLAYRQHFDEPGPAADKLGVFSTGPALRSYPLNVLTEVIATFVLVFAVLVIGKTPSGLGPLATALIVVAIGISLGGPTGYAINPARDLGPRIAHAVLPIKGKGGSDWSYAWVPVVGPLLGAVLAGLTAGLYVG
ncbi:glycerol transporter [Tsukamurella pulmonis]|uniref:Glycerol uptake facilitator protein n=1 Tax=Tsukamurella pulmonis TaxID=47312 RepID=A0A1H1H237_9ACTN|nr:MIP/aquaporin family protein [Tsukamurella pulmonis]KXO88090.1 glycerol transporter [Tsukamurella pulmonis]BDD81308.1 glycerol transporter [Tsukamurella pulmonis]SDR19545.1 glycerol uptake facilitator protein [Tsukamurella pulmonis]SUP16115.1 Glyceroaquaporin [Tsukamurella pulmonis]